MEVRAGGAWRTITSGEAFVTGAWRRLKYAEAYVGGAWRRIATFVDPMTLSISGTVDAASASPAMTSSSVTATPSGGSSPFTYAWAVESSSNLTSISINSPSSASTTVTATVVGGSGTVGSITLRCTATDSLGSTATDTTPGNFTYDTSIS